MTGPDPALAQALDSLTTQVNPDNVLAVHKVFKDHADALERELHLASLQARVGLCGLDPVSIDAARSFNNKVGELLDVHRAHQRELTVAANHLREIALSYGHTDDDIAQSLQQSQG